MLRYRYYQSVAIDRKRSAFLVVDLQNDFCEGGALAVPGGGEVVGIVNGLLPRFDRTVLSQDWHPRGHVSFASTWPGRELYESVEAEGIPQILWPEHCIQGSDGAAFHPGLRAEGAALILRKGFRARLDSYSCFFENDRKTPTGLDGWLRSIGVSELYIAGLATDFCVLYTALDALRLGLSVLVVEDAVRGVDRPSGSVGRALAEMRRKGVSFVNSGSLS
jgi:nicotinamidase/pyrazinamidase